MPPPPRPLRFRSGGNLREGDFYVERAPDRELYDALLAGEYCHLLAPRQIGKSSLRVRTERRLREKGVRCASVDLTAISDGVGGGGTPEQWYATLAEKLADRLKLEEDAAKAAWLALQGTLSHRWIRFLREQVLARDPAPVVLFLDEIDYIQRAAFCGDFFSSIRAMYNLRAEDPDFQRLTFCLVGVAAPADLIDDAALTPFNIGQAIRLEDFTADEAKALLPGLAGLSGDPQKLLSAVLAWTSGHPYMTQRLCETLATRRGKGDEADAAPLSEEARVAQVVKELFLQRREEDLNLTAAEKRLEQSPKRSPLLRLYRRLLESTQVAAHKDDPIQFELRLTGMAAQRHDASGERWLRVRNRIFATVFDRDWLERKEPNPLLAQVLPLWLKSGKNEEYLLRGPLLQEAQAWAQGRADLSAEERDFLMAGMSAEQRAEQSAALEKERQQRAVELDKARRKRIRSQFILIMLLGLALFLSLFEGLRARRATQAARTSEKSAVEAKEQAIAAEGKVQEQLKLTEAAKQREREEKEKVQALLVSEKAAKETAIVAESKAKKAEADANDAATKARQAELKAVEAEALEREQREKAESASRLASQKQAEAEQSAQAEKAARALVLTGQAGREFEALVVAMEAAKPALSKYSQLLLQEMPQDEGQEGLLKAVDALIAAASSMSYAVPQSLILRAGQERVRAVHFSSDGTQAIATYQDGQQVSWDAGSGQRLSVQMPGEQTHAVASGEDAARDSRLALAEGRVHIYDARHREVNAFGDNVERAVLSPSGKLVATTSRTAPSVLIYQVDSGEAHGSLEGHQSRVLSMRFSPDEKSLLTASKDGTARIWPLDGSQPAIILRGHGSAVNAAVYSPDGRRVLTGSDDGTARIWQPGAGLPGDDSPRMSPAAEPLLLGVMTLSHQSAVNGVAFSPDGSRLLTIGWNNRGTLWDRSGARLAELSGHTGVITSAQFSRDGKYVVTASQDGTARLWELPTGKEARDLTASQHREAVNTAEVSPDGKQVVTASKDGLVQLFDSQSGQAVRIFREDGAPESRCALPPAGRLAATRGPASAAATAATFSPDGRFILTGYSDGQARLWERMCKKDTHAALKLAGGVTSVAFSPNSQLAAVASQSGVVTLAKVDDAANVVSVQELKHASAVNLVSFSHDGTILLSASRDGTAKLWDVATGQQRTPPLKDHSGEIFAAVFSRDDRLVATASQDQTARIWDARTGRSLATLRGARGSVYAVDFSSDGRKLVTASLDQTARLYSTDVVDYFKLGCRLLRYQPEYENDKVRCLCEPCDPPQSAR